MVNIRIMTINDYDSVYDLWINTSGMGLNSIDDSREWIEKYIKRNPTASFVAEDNGTIIGVIIAGHDGRRGYIYHIAVLPEYRNHGIARKLAAATMEAFNEEKINKAALVAFTRNEIGNGFWEKA